MAMGFNHFESDNLIKSTSIIFDRQTKSYFSVVGDNAVYRSAVDERCGLTYDRLLVNGVYGGIGSANRIIQMIKVKSLMFAIFADQNKLALADMSQDCPEWRFATVEVPGSDKNSKFHICTIFSGYRSVYLELEYKSGDECKQLAELNYLECSNLPQTKNRFEHPTPLRCTPIIKSSYGRLDIYDTRQDIYYSDGERISKMTHARSVEYRHGRIGVTRYDAISGNDRYLVCYDRSTNFLQLITCRSMVLCDYVSRSEMLIRGSGCVSVRELEMRRVNRVDLVFMVSSVYDDYILHTLAVRKNRFNMVNSTVFKPYRGVLKKAGYIIIEKHPMNIITIDRMLRLSINI